MNDGRNISKERLAEVLDAYGADAARWPQAERAGLLRLASDDPQAARLLQEARALDRLLALGDREPARAPALGPLGNRILADFAAVMPAAAGGPAGGGEVVAFPGPRARMQRLPRRQPAVVAAALAACFALGIYLGSVGLAGWTLDPVTSVAGLSGDETQVANVNELLASDAIIDEDLL
jgi:transposase